ncbi:MAG: response regulator [Kiloniellaceae bacterium]
MKDDKLTVLVIDDDPLYRQTLQDILSDGGYDVLLAENGKEGSKAVARDRIDLVVCDILMPEKDGIETILELRNSHPGLKIIAVSGGRLESGLHLHAARQLGADAGLEKPIHSAELLNLAARLTAGCD